MVTTLIADAVSAAKAGMLAEAQSAADVAIKDALAGALDRLATLETKANEPPPPPPTPSSTLTLTTASEDGGNDGAAPTIEIRATGGGTLADGAGVEFAVTRPTDEEVSASASVTVSALGMVGFGVADPQERVSINGNMQLNGDLLLGADGANILELVTGLRADLDEAAQQSLDAQVKYSSCAVRRESVYREAWHAACYMLHVVQTRGRSISVLGLSHV